jgi:transcriptional regulator with XRE-family HTH domain
MEGMVLPRPMRVIRAERGFSMQGLSDRSGCSVKTILDVELGRRVPTQRTVRRLAESLDVPLGEVREFRLAMDCWSSYRKAGR